MTNLPTSVVQISFMDRGELELALRDAMEIIASLSGWQTHPLYTLRRLERDTPTLIRLTAEIGDLTEADHDVMSWEQIGRTAINTLQEDFKQFNRRH